MNTSYRTRRRAGQIITLIGGALLILAVIGVITLIGLAITSSQFWNSSP